MNTDRWVVFAFVAGFAGARFIACTGWFDITPAEAYAIETRQCAAKPDPEDRRRCESLLEKKYARYWREGDYPRPTPTSHPPPDRGR